MERNLNEGFIFWIGGSRRDGVFGKWGHLKSRRKKLYLSGRRFLTACEPWRERNLETRSPSAHLMSIAPDYQQNFCGDDDALTWRGGGKSRPGSACCSFTTMTMERQISHRYASCSTDHDLHALANRKCAKVTPKSCLKVWRNIKNRWNWSSYLRFIIFSWSFLKDL